GQQVGRARGGHVIVHINHIAPSKKKTAGQSPVSQLAGLVNGTMLSMVEDGVLDARLAPSLRVHLDWIQYKTNFREPVMVRCPADLIGLEIGVGTGARAAAWLDAFKAFDAAAGGTFYPRMHFILGDYSPTSLERAMAAVAHHAGHVSAVPLDALNPVAALGAHRFKVMYVHSTNTYDNLPFDDLVRRDGKLYLVETRAYLNGAAADGLVADFGLSREELPEAATRLLEGGPFAVFPGPRGVEFWRRLWDAFKLEERLVALDE